MFGFEILDVVIGLILVYLVLSLFATALNEYISAVFNLRGKELARGLYRLLDDVDERGAITSALDGLTLRNVDAASLTERLYAHPLIRPLATRRGSISFWRKSPRLPSYIPARTFAMALLDTLGVRDADASLAPPAAGAPPAPGADQPATLPGGISRDNLLKVLDLLKRESALDVSQARGALAGLLGSSGLAADVQVRLLDALTATETQLNKLQESVEVWFNDAMDRVSGAYKRTTQGVLFVLGLLISGCMNADTIEMWRRLQSDDNLRAAMVRRAESTVAALDSTWADSARSTLEPDSQPATPPTPPATGTTATADSQTVAIRSTPPTPPATGTTTTTDSARWKAVEQARQNYQAARSRVDSLELNLGWTVEEAVRVGLLRKDAPGQDTAATSDTTRRTAQPLGVVPATGDSAVADSVAPKPTWIPAGYSPRPFFFLTSQAGFLKLIGLLLTAIAISLGAPFWFDLLNKVISIRAAGRSPEERPKSPEATAKRMSERAPK